MNEESTDDLIVIVNKRIHENANISKKEFINRIKHVKGIRTTSNFGLLTYYITSLNEYSWLEKFHKIVNTGNFDVDYLTNDTYYIFAFAIKTKLYSWFKNNSIQTIKKQIINWLAARYFFDIDSREVMEENLYKPFLDEIIGVVKQYYSEHYDSENYQEIYKKVSMEYVGSLPPEFMENYYHTNRSKGSWGITDYNSFLIIESYLTASDWNSIILKDIDKLKKQFNKELESKDYTIEMLNDSIEEPDDLMRAESSQEMWNKWKHTYLTDDDKKNFVFTILNKPLTNDTKGYIYLIRKENTNICKIGWTKNENVDKRISSIQTSNPQKLEKLGMFKAASIETEKTLHRIFENQRLSGEWFELSESDIDNILSSDWRILNNIF